MTILSACQSAAIRLSQGKPEAIFSSSKPFGVELADLSNEVATDISKSHDWQALTKVALIEGDGTTVAFPLPDDYDRMLLKSDILDSNNFAWGYKRLTDINEFLLYKVRGIGVFPGVWILYGNAFQFYPAPPDGAMCNYPYISKLRVQDSSEDLKVAFTADTDAFLLDERLMTLGLIWKWREMKGLDYSAAEANFTKAFNEISGTDKGSRILRDRRSPSLSGASLAYPWPLGS